MLQDATTIDVFTDHPLVAALSPDVMAATTHEDWYDRGAALHTDGHVRIADLEDDGVFALIDSSSRDDAYVVTLTARDGDVVADCDCPVRQRHRVLWCKHRVAVGLAVLTLAGADVRRPTRFADVVPAQDIPLGWTVTFGDGRVRHLPWTGRGGVRRRKDGTASVACGLDGQAQPAVTNMPICATCERLTGQRQLDKLAQQD